MSHRVHILGASGSGTTTLGAAIAEMLSCAYFDSDTYFWVPTDPPFQQVRQREQRLEMLSADLQGKDDWVLSGSLCGWGDPIIPLFSLVVFLWIPQELRMKRLQQRERQRFGEQVLSPGGVRHKQYLEFLEWARRYDAGGPEMRSRQQHEQWLALLPHKILRLEGDMDTASRLRAVQMALET